MGQQCQSGDVVNVEKYQNFIIFLQVQRVLNFLKAQLSKSLSKLFILEKQRSLKAVQGATQLLEIIRIRESFQLVVIDWCSKLCISKGINSIILLNFQVKAGDDCHQCLKCLNGQCGSVGVFCCCLKVTINADLSFIFYKISVIIKLILKDLD